MKFDSASRRIGRPEGWKPRRPGYGERKRAREAAKVPLLADSLPSADEYERRLIESMADHVRQQRHLAAQQWMKVRRWLRQATPEKRAEFERRWNARWHPPHTPEYAADLCHQIDTGGAGVSAGWGAELACWSVSGRKPRRRKVAGILLAVLVCTMILSCPAMADVGQGRCWLLRPQERYMLAFGYTSGEESTGKHPGDLGYGLTSRGTLARYGVCAADPCVPYGTRLWVEGYGLAVVEDRGGDIRGERLDLWMESVPQALTWGRRRVRVVILD